MAKKENEFQEIFLAEASENTEELNRLFTELEKTPEDKRIIQGIFRIVHTLKGNALGLGFEGVADMSHILEDTFTGLLNGDMPLTVELMDVLFKANDKLAELIQAVGSKKVVRYKGIRTKLQVLSNQLLKEHKPADSPPKAEPAAPSDKPKTEPVAEAAPDKEPAAEAEADAIEVTESTDEAPVPVHEQLAKEQESTSAIRFSDAVSIPVRKLDTLMNLVGELIIERDTLLAGGLARNGSTSEYARLLRISSDLQYGIMDARLMQLGFMFKKFYRVTRDAASKEGKLVDLQLEGTEIEIDRNILKVISDSLVHLVRNAVSHGVETKAERIAAGKSERGTIILRGRNEKDMVLIDVIDDGGGVDVAGIRAKAIEKGLVTKEGAAALSDEDVTMFIFEPGFSNAETITDVSGRGVGMDVVRRSTESIGGNVSVKCTPGAGSIVTLHLPSSMAVKGALLFMLNDQEYAVPLSYTEAVISLYKKDIHRITNGLMCTYLEHTLSIIFLEDLFDLENLQEIEESGALQKSYRELDEGKKLDVLVVSYQDRHIGIVVDKLLQQQEIVEKTLVPPLEGLKLFSGATILGNGNVCLVLDIAQILRSVFKEQLTYA
jgi:two-component system chemotaxis sensor kinase CheA